MDESKNFEAQVVVYSIVFRRVECQNRDTNYEAMLRPIKTGHMEDRQRKKQKEYDGGKCVSRTHLMIRNVWSISLVENITVEIFPL